MANRFFKPGQSQYQSQFVPEKLPLDMMAKGLTAKQGKYDATAAQIQELSNKQKIQGYGTTHTAEADRINSARDEFVENSYNRDLTSPEFIREYNKFTTDQRDNPKLATIKARNASVTAYREEIKELKRSNQFNTARGHRVQKRLDQALSEDDVFEDTLGDAIIGEESDVRKAQETIFNDLKANSSEGVAELMGIFHKEGISGVSGIRITATATNAYNQFINTSAGKQEIDEYNMQVDSGQVDPEETTQQQFVLGRLLNVGASFGYEKTTTTGKVKAMNDIVEAANAAANAPPMDTPTQITGGTPLVNNSYEKDLGADGLSGTDARARATLESNIESLEATDAAIAREVTDTNKNMILGAEYGDKVIEFARLKEEHAQEVAAWEEQQEANPDTQAMNPWEQYQADNPDILLTPEENDAYLKHFTNTRDKLQYDIYNGEETIRKTSEREAEAAYIALGKTDEGRELLQATRDFGDDVMNDVINWDNQDLLDAQISASVAGVELFEEREFETTWMDPTQKMTDWITGSDGTHTYGVTGEIDTETGLIRDYTTVNVGGNSQPIMRDVKDAEPYFRHAGFKANRDYVDGGSTPEGLAVYLKKLHAIGDLRKMHKLGEVAKEIARLKAEVPEEGKDNRYKESYNKVASEHSSQGVLAIDATTRKKFDVVDANGKHTTTLDSPIVGLENQVKYNPSAFNVVDGSGIVRDQETYDASTVKIVSVNNANPRAGDTSTMFTFSAEVYSTGYTQLVIDNAKRDGILTPGNFKDGKILDNLSDGQKLQMTKSQIKKRVNFTANIKDDRYDASFKKQSMIRDQSIINGSPAGSTAANEANQRMLNITKPEVAKIAKQVGYLNDGEYYNARILMYNPVEGQPLLKEWVSIKTTKHVGTGGDLDRYEVISTSASGEVLDKLDFNSIYDLTMAIGTQEDRLANAIKDKLIVEGEIYTTKKLKKTIEPNTAQ